MQGQSVTVTDFSGNNVGVSLVPVPFNASVQTAVFSAYMPAAGFSTYFLEFASQSESSNDAHVVCSVIMMRAIMIDEVISRCVCRKQRK